MAGDNSAKWTEATNEILRKLDIVAEYRALGLDICSSKPSAKGWLEARAFGMDDRTPSAGINVAEGAMLGRYKSFRDGTTLGLFDFAATKAGKFAGDWRSARAHYARVAGVELPNGEDKVVADRFEFTDLTAGTMLNYAQGKPGVAALSIRELGARRAVWPKNLSADKTNHMIVFPMYGGALLELEPTGWHCVHVNPGKKIRKWQGEGHEEQLLDKMTAGEPGLMNVDGLKRLPEADVVNIVEGISDLLAGQSVLMDWRAADPDNRQHVFLSAGACTYHPKADWMDHFAGKEVRLWFDVGDSKDEGQVAAGVWIKALLQVTDKVRNVKLPLGPEGTKNDLRAWLVGGTQVNPSSHSYIDMCDYAMAFPFVSPEDEIAQTTIGDAVLNSLGLTVIGEYENRAMIEVYSETRRKSATVMDVNKLTVPTLIQMLGSEVVDKYIHDGKECPPDKYDLKAVKFAIAHAASDKTFYGDEKYGAGVWEHDGKLVLVKSKEVAILNGHGYFEQSFVPFVAGRVLDCGRASGDWYDLETVNRYLAAAKDHKWCLSVIDEAYKLFDLWNWRQKQQAPFMLTGLVICSWLQSIWKYRPQVFVTGNSNTGKTVLLQDIVSRGIFGPLGLFVEKPTEAAISQKLRHHSMVIFVDEFEKDAHRQRVLELFRTTSRGGVKIRGTADHRGISFRLQHIPWLSSIETGLHKEADKNRYIILELDTITTEKRKAFNLPATPTIRDLGTKLLAIGIAHYQETKRLVEVLNTRQMDGVPSRCIESFALPVAALAAAGGVGDEAAAKLLGDVLTGWDFSAQVSSDHIECLSTILTSQVDLRGGEKRNVSTLLREVLAGETKTALDRVGIRKIRRHSLSAPGEHEQVLWVCPAVAGRTLLKGTGFEGHTIDQYLMRFSGARPSRQRLGGDERFRGIEIPLEVVWQAFEANDDDYQHTAEGGEFSDTATTGHSA